MKKIISSATAFALLLPMLLTPSVSAAGEAVSYSRKEVTGYLFGMDSSETFSCLFRPDMNIPYISAADFLNQIYTAAFTTTKNSDGTYSVTNKNGAMVVDPEKDTVHFDMYEKVAYFDCKPYLDSEKCEYLGNESYRLLEETEHPLDLDLGKYHIDVTADGGNVYFPLSTIADIFAPSYHSAIYLDSNIYFVKVIEDDPYFNTDSLCSGTARDRTLIDYAYNELCFVMDNFYGKPAKSPLAVTMKSNDFDKALDAHNELTVQAKQLLHSENKVDYTFALLYLDGLLNDGGHTGLSSGMLQLINRNPESVLTAAVQKRMADISVEERANAMQFILELSQKEDQRAKLKELRESSYKSYDKVKEWDDCALFQSGKTFIFMFDEFRDKVVEPFKWSLDRAADNGCENFIIDLSANSGGSSAVAMYMLSIMTDNPNLLMVNTKTGNKMEESASVDKNLDDAFDEKDDKVAYSFRFAILTTRYSFSCGNLVPCLAQERGVPILGETSGGGTCMLSKLYAPDGCSFAISNTLTMVNSKGQDIEGGAAPDRVLVTENTDGELDYSECYQVDAINAALKEVPVAPSSQPTTAEEAPSTAAEEETAAAQTARAADSEPSGSVPLYAWFLVCGLLAAGTAAAAMAVILIIRRHRRIHAGEKEN